MADFRAALPAPVATGGINANQGAKWAGTWWTRQTAMSKRYRPPTPSKKNPAFADTRTAEQKAAYESASSTQFKDTGGDMTKIIKKAFELYRSYVQKRGAANVATRDLAAHLQDFGGASSNACWGPEIQLPDDQLESGGYYVEIKKAVAYRAAVPDTVKDGKVVKKGKAEVKAQDATYRKLK